MNIETTERDTNTRLVTYQSKAPLDLKCKKYERLVVFEIPKEADDHTTHALGCMQDGF